MSLRLTLFTAISVLVHAGALLWSQTVDPQFKLGGEARALRISIAAARPAETPPRPAEKLTAPERIAERHSANDVGSPAVHHLTQADARATQVIPSSPITQTSPPGRHTLYETRESTYRPAPAEQSAPDINRRISVALKNRMFSYFEYPWLARQRGWEGRVLLSLTVMGNGDLGNWKIARTSGYRTLDQSALKAAQRIERLPQAAAWLNGESLEVQVPVQYRLLDS